MHLTPVVLYCTQGLESSTCSLKQCHFRSFLFTATRLQSLLLHDQSLFPRQGHTTVSVVSNMIGLPLRFKKTKKHFFYTTGGVNTLQVTRSLISNRYAVYYLKDWRQQEKNTVIKIKHQFKFYTGLNSYPQKVRVPQAPSLQIAKKCRSFILLAIDFVLILQNPVC